MNDKQFEVLQSCLSPVVSDSDEQVKFSYSQWEFSKFSFLDSSIFENRKYHAILKS